MRRLSGLQSTAEVVCAEASWKTAGVVRMIGVHEHPRRVRHHQISVLSGSLPHPAEVDGLFVLPLVSLRTLTHETVHPPPLCRSHLGGSHVMLSAIDMVYKRVAGVMGWDPSEVVVLVDPPCQQLNSVASPFMLWLAREAPNAPAQLPDVFLAWTRRAFWLSLPGDPRRVSLSDGVLVPSIRKLYDLHPLLRCAGMRR